MLEKSQKDFQMGQEILVTLSLSLVTSLLKKVTALNFPQPLYLPPPRKGPLMLGAELISFHPSGQPWGGGAGSSKWTPLLKRTQRN